MTHRIDIAPFLGTVAEPIYKLKGKVRKGVPRKIEKRNVNNGNVVKQQFMVANASSLVRRMKERKGTVKSGATRLQNDYKITPAIVRELSEALDKLIDGQPLVSCKRPTSAGWKRQERQDPNATCVRRPHSAGLYRSPTRPCSAASGRDHSATRIGQTCRGLSRLWRTSSISANPKSKWLSPPPDSKNNNCSLSPTSSFGA